VGREGKKRAAKKNRKNSLWLRDLIGIQWVKPTRVLEFAQSALSTAHDPWTTRPALNTSLRKQSAHQVLHRSAATMISTRLETYRACDETPSAKFA
jgi:biotin synthase-related radical SAM superfamily protein